MMTTSYTVTRSDKLKFRKKEFRSLFDRLLFLSLVKDFKKIPDHMRIQTKLDIFRVINDTLRFSD